MEHHADFAVAIQRKLMVTSTSDPSDGIGPIAGEVIAIGWWVQDEDDPDHTPTGTLYLIADQRRPRPMWVKEADLTGVRLGD